MLKYFLINHTLVWFFIYLRCINKLSELLNMEKAMNLDEIEKLINNDLIQVDMYMCHWLIDKKNNQKELKVVHPTIEKKLKKQLKHIVEFNIDEFKGYDITDYNITGCDDYKIESTSVKKYKDEIDLIFEALEGPHESDDNIKIDDFAFFVYKFSSKDSDDKHDFYAFRRTKKFKALKTGFWGVLEDGKYDSLDTENVLGTDSWVDFFLYEDDILILQHISLERILKLENEFKEKAERVLSSKLLSQKIKNFDKLKTDALNNQNYIKRLSKLDGTRKVNLFLTKLDRTKDVIDKLKLDIEVDIKSDKLVYNNNSQLGEFINLMQDAYYKTLIGEENGVDERKNLIS